MLVRAILFLIDSLAGLLSLALLLRFFMQAFHVSFRNPLGQFILAVTNWLVLPFRRVLPGLFGLDMASLLPAYLVQLLPPMAALLLYDGAMGSSAPYASIVFLFGQALRATLRLCAHLMVAALILRAIFSWFAIPTPIAQPVSQLTRPLLQPIQRFLPLVGGFDLSPLVAVLALELVILFL